MSLDHAILGFLSERPRTGYDLKTRCFGAGAMALWEADQAQIYRTLERLHREKLVTYSRRRSAGRPDRRIFEITHAGRDALAAWLASPLPSSPIRDPFALQLWFGASIDDSSLLDLLVTRREQHQARLDRLRTTALALAEDQTLTERSQVLRQTAYDGAILRERATVDWLGECVEAVRQGALPGADHREIGQRHLSGETPA
jgi:DNA-binding PadR family transcriptional regulator